MKFVSEYVTQNVRVNEIDSCFKHKQCAVSSFSFPFCPLCPSEQCVKGHFFEVTII